MSLANIPHIIPVLSGKGGVGKSSVTVQLALSLCLRGHSVGVLDIDLTGPSLPHLFGIEGEKVRQAPGGWLPVQVHPNSVTSLAANGTNNGPLRDQEQAATQRKIGSLYCMSLGFLLRSRGDAIVWRGPKKTAMVTQLLSEVLWPTEVTYLLIDTPPGTSDEHITLAQNLLDPNKYPQPPPPAPQRSLAAVIVTTPQAISTADVKKELSFCMKVEMKVLGVVENMAGFVCPCCGEVTNVFSKGGGEVMAKEWGVKFLGSVPLDGEGWGMLIEEGKRPAYGAVGQSNGQEQDMEMTDDSVPRDEGSLVERYTSCSLSPIFNRIVEQLEKNEATFVVAPSASA